MKDLIDALLTLSRFSRADFNRSTVDLTAIIKKALEDCAARWPDRKVEMVVADGVMADGDPTLLQIVIFNLVENALKFTKLKPIAKIEFGFKNIEGKEVYFLRDNGTGFHMEIAKRLFAPFQRLYADSDFPGLGTGLATVQRIIQRHGGRIWAESEPDQGAIFYFTLL
jgi:signal transduction histidine kinase